MEEKSKDSLKPLVSPPAVNSKASILILALWSLCLLSTFAVSLGIAVRQKLTLVNRLDEKDRLRFIAEAGIKKAISRLKEEPEKDYAALNDGWSNNSIVFKEISIGNGKFSLSHAHINERTGLTEPWYGLTDEEGKLNINKAGQTIMERLFRILDYDEMQAQELAAAIIDWRDNDSELSIPLGSAEDSYYRNLKYPYEAKDADFQVLEELLLVKGIDKDIYEKIKNYITIYGSGRINVNTASKIILLALGINADTADAIISFRLGEDGIIGTADDNVFDTPANIAPKLSQFSHLSDSAIAGLSIIAGQYLVTNSHNFMARCISQLNGRKKTAEVISVINRSGKILYWQES